MARDNVARNLLFPVLLLAFCTWVVYLAGLASVQKNCNDQVPAGTNMNALNTDSLVGVYGFSANVLRCNAIFRYHWFIAAFEFVVLLGALIAAATHHGIERTRGFWVGMFSIATLLYMIMSEAFLAGISSNFNASGANRKAFRAAAAGAIMTVVTDIACLFVIGSDWGHQDRGDDKAGHTMERPGGTGPTTPAGGMAAV